MVADVAPGTANEMRLHVAGAELHLLRGGSGEPLLVLHGEEGPRGWRQYHERLTSAFDVIAPTMPGTGTSERPDWLDSVPRLAKFYWWALDELGLDRVSILGASLGGWVAAEMATMCTERVQRLILVSPMGIAPDHGEIYDLFMVTYREYIERAFSTPNVPEYEQIWGTPPTEEVLEEEVLISEMAARLGFRPYMHDRGLPPVLRRVSAPSLIVSGTVDEITPPACAAAYEAWLPNATLVRLNDVGHFAHLEQPDLLCDTVLGFAAGNGAVDRGAGVAETEVSQ